MGADLAWERSSFHGKISVHMEICLCKCWFAYSSACLHKEVYLGPAVHKYCKVHVRLLFSLAVWKTLLPSSWSCKVTWSLCLFLPALWAVSHPKSNKIAMNYGSYHVDSQVNLSHLQIAFVTVMQAWVMLPSRLRWIFLYHVPLWVINSTYFNQRAFSFCGLLWWVLGI